MGTELINRPVSHKNRIMFDVSFSFVVVRTNPFIYYSRLNKGSEMESNSY